MKVKKMIKSKFVSYDSQLGVIYECDFSWQSFSFKGTYTHPTGEKIKGNMELNVILN
jgi:hypothetical protein